MSHRYSYNESERVLTLDGETHEKIAEVQIGDETFYVPFTEKTQGELDLLQGAETPEQIQKLVRLLSVLRTRTPILLVGEDRETETDTATVRRAWFQALRAVDSSASEQLKDRLAENGGSDTYIRR